MKKKAKTPSSKPCSEIPDTLLGDDMALAAANMEAILSSPSNLLAIDDRALLDKVELRGVRMLLELDKAELAFQDHGADECGRLEPGGAHLLGERRKIRFEPEDQIVANTVLGWIESRHQRGVRGQRERCRREHRFEAHPFSCDAVQRRGVRSFSAVAAQPIGPQRVDADEDHPLDPAAASTCRGGSRQQQQEEGLQPARRRSR